MSPTTIRLGELTFDVADSGPADSPVVLLLHGFPQSRHCWDEVAGQLNAHGYRTVAPDQRGYSPGARPPAVSGYAIPELVADVIGLLDAIGVDTAHIVGHDWGAIVAWYTAVHHPERTRTLTALSVPHPAAFAWARDHDPDQRRRSAYIDLFRREGAAEDLFFGEQGGLRRLFVPPLTEAQAAPHLALLSTRPALTAALNWYRALDSGFGDLGPSAVPTTYLWSTDDPALGRAGALRCERHVTGPYRFVRLDGISHWIPEQAPAAVTREILTRAATA
ncbi:alpha/beta fold hydrolase [Amycolatopsis suaedae]|uniref:Alpha/beta hydrolase n=1 Tax=Amycolatopsis suaedae TaxID=2510978 RepID=A0A4V2ELG1_9PSEU|nr:alpha/beta hydrolase [Amycolatopsis suaedae]RZQ61445.1 alpha/beta hydrolase [Amycolatopsis suaedae]